MKILSVKDIMNNYGVCRQVATAWAKAAGTTPRVKKGKIYVTDTALEKYLGGNK